MMRDFGSPADAVLHGSSGSRISSNRSSIERLYSSLVQSDDDDNDDNESLRSYTSGSSGAKFTPPLCKQQKFLFPQKEFVDKLRPEEVRWFYRRKDQNEKWSPFIGYDSLRIECRYRALQTVLDDNDEIDNDVIIVRGGLYQVDVVEKTCIPIYWSGDVAEILRGMWFYDNTWQPIEEAYSIQIETEHLAKFLGRRLDEEQPQPVKGKKPVLHHIRFQDFYIDWNGPNEVYEFSESTSSRIVRSVRNNLGLNNSGSRIHRGYIHEAIMEDKPADISHLVFVIHGIGQKMETGNIVKRCHELRNRTRSLKDKFFPYFDSNTCNQRSEFLPVEWRTSLKLDGDTVESITPQKIKGIRTVLNSSAMDILYYTSPLYRSEITHSLQTELNRLYELFCSKNPYFIANGGKVSIVAHSLGAVISYDIISGWNPIQLYDKFVNSVIDDEEEQAVGSDELLGELEEAKKRVNELESLLTKVHEKQKSETSTLKFQIENLFCLGSPLAVFLALRGIRPKGKGTIDHILPSTDCKRLFNIYHPYDPVAYRLEPLILKHYATLMPLPIHSFNAPKKTPYVHVKATAYAAFKSSDEKLNEKGDQSDKDFVDSMEIGSSGSRDASPARNQKFSLFSGMFRRNNSASDMSAELKMLQKMEKDAKLMEDTIQKKQKQCEQIDQTDLEYRIDYQLRESSFENSYISMLTSHTSYWTNKDVAFFILTHLHPEMQDSCD